MKFKHKLKDFNKYKHKEETKLGVRYYKIIFK